MNYYLGIDVGTSLSKGVLIDQSGTLISSAEVAHEVQNPKPGYYEMDADKVWWHDTCQLCKSLLKQSKISPQDIKGVGLSACSPCVLPVDDKGRPLRPGILYGIDSRAMPQIEAMKSYYGERAKQLFRGQEICTSDVMPKILWIKENEPEVFDQTAKFLTASSYMTYKLTGQMVLDRFVARSFYMPCYKEDLSIDPDLCQELYCRPDQLPKALEGYQIAGTITQEAAKATGLAVGTPVLPGSDDSAAEAVSTGVLTNGDLMIQLGSTMYMIYCTDQLFSDNRLWNGDYLSRGSYCISGGTNSCGSLTRWLRDTLCFDLLEQEQQGGENAYQAMAKLATAIEPGSDGIILLPYLAGERTPLNDPLAKGLVFGLSDRHSRAHIIRAGYEAVAFSIAQHLDILKQHGALIEELFVSGGGALNALWCQIIADVCGVRVKCAKVTIGASYGDALMALVGEKGNPQTLKEMIQVDKVYLPNQDLYDRYQSIKQRFTRLYLATKDLMHES